MLFETVTCTSTKCTKTRRREWKKLNCDLDGMNYKEITWEIGTHEE